MAHRDVNVADILLQLTWFMTQIGTFRNKKCCSHFSADNPAALCHQTITLSEHLTTSCIAVHVYQLRMHGRLCMKSRMFVWNASYLKYGMFRAYFCERVYVAVNKSLWSKSECLFFVHRRNQGQLRFTIRLWNISDMDMAASVDRGSILHCPRFVWMCTMCWLEYGTASFGIGYTLLVWTEVWVVWLID